LIEIKNLKKTYHVKQGAVEALRSVSLKIEQGEFFVLLGSSGSGKTTLLRSVAGLETPDAGEISIGGTVVFSKERSVVVPPEERQLGMVFQSYAIWPHMTVFANVALPLTLGRQKIPKGDIRARTMEALRLVQLEELADRPAPLLSGGQQQRVALARALAVNPKLVLMDEPLSNLDARLREEMRTQIRDLAKRLRMTVLYVTHDQEEAMVLGDRIGVMVDGRLVSQGLPEDLYEKPPTQGMAEFFGSITWLEGKAVNGHGLETRLGILRVGGNYQNGATGMAGIRPEDIELSEGLSGAANEFQGDVRSRTFLGDQVIYAIQINGVTIEVKTMSKKRLGERPCVRLPEEKIKFYPNA
jgi:iron(III) transport system ATP-binding protein